jgi:hypothetical protein
MVARFVSAHFRHTFGMSEMYADIKFAAWKKSAIHHVGLNVGLNCFNPSFNPTDGLSRF